MEVTIIVVAVLCILLALSTGYQKMSFKDQIKKLRFDNDNRIINAPALVYMASSKTGFRGRIPIDGPLLSPIGELIIGLILFSNGVTNGVYNILTNHDTFYGPSATPHLLLMSSKYLGILFIALSIYSTVHVLKVRWSKHPQVKKMDIIELIAIFVVLGGMSALAIIKQW